MKIIDTHAHLFGEEFSEDLGDVVRRAKSIGIEKVLLPNIDENTICDLKKSVEQFPSIFIPMMGLHPTSVTQNWTQQLLMIKKELDDGHYIAVGEIGIDLYWDKTLQQEQIAAFETQLQWSIEKQLPVSIHSRNAIAETINSIKHVGNNLLHGVFHSFGGNNEELKQILDLQNFYIGVNGVVTFKNSGLSDILKNCDINKIILETDSPYLSPMPYRGKRNEPVRLKEVIIKLSEIFELTEQEVAEITTKNATNLFNIGAF